MESNLEKYEMPEWMTEPENPDEDKQVLDYLSGKSNMFSQINDLVKLCHNRSKEAGWHDNQREVGTMIALIHSEASEALEGFRKDLMDDHLPHRKMAEVELADIIIRVCDLAGKENMDLGGAIREKLEYNLNRKDHKKENRDSVNGKRF